MKNISSFFFRIRPLEFKMNEWSQWSFRKKIHRLCITFSGNGFGSPFIAVVYHLIINVSICIWLWIEFCRFSAIKNFGYWSWDINNMSWWIFTPEAFQKALFTMMLTESLGFGGGHGPMMMRLLPPITLPFHAFWPGTIRQPAFSSLPFCRGNTRTWFDVLLYMAHIVFLLRMLIAPQLSLGLILPTIILLPIIGLRDKMLFLSARGEHLWAASFPAIFLYIFPFSETEVIAGWKVCWFFIWFWAAFSKLNYHFPGVISVMIMNNPILPFKRIKRFTLKKFPTDFRPSIFIMTLARFGIFTEFSIGVLLLVGNGENLTNIMLWVMVIFHAFIILQVPMAAPITWNIMMVYGGFYLFDHHATVSVFILQSPWLITFLTCTFFLQQILGNLYPKHMSFLMAMKYYAGNWPYTIWFLKPGAMEKIDTHVKKISKTIPRQFGVLYDKEIAESMLPRMIPFRIMHTQGRIIQLLIDKAVDNPNEYIWHEGEALAGICTGWNFGDGHLHDEFLLNALHERCHFKPGEVRVIIIEAQPLFNKGNKWRIADAASGQIAEGYIKLSQYKNLNPWEKMPDL